MPQGLAVAVDLIGAKSGPKFFRTNPRWQARRRQPHENSGGIADQHRKNVAGNGTFGKKLGELKNNIMGVLGPMGMLAVEASKSTADFANFFLAALQGNSKAMEQFIGQSNSAADAALRAKYMSQDAAAAADIESAMAVFAGDKKKKALVDVALPKRPPRQ